MCDLRAYRPGDEAAVFELVRTVLGEYGLATNPEATDRDLQDIGRSYVASGGAFKVLEEAGRIVGSYGLFRLSATTCELRKMYLSRDRRGLGLGRRMMDDALAEARARGFFEMVLETNRRLTEAIALYRAYGFADFQPDHLSDRCDLAMRKAL